MQMYIVVTGPSEASSGFFGIYGRAASFRNLLPTNQSSNLAHFH